MLAAALCTTLLALESRLVHVEVESFRGPPFFDLVGLPEASVRESRVRVRSALNQLGVSLDEYRIVVNLAPGDVRKGGSAFDLAIAVATLAALGVVPPESAGSTLLLGELTLAGALLPVQGALPQLLFARQSGIAQVVVPSGNSAEASAVNGLDVLVARSLGDVVEHLCGRAPLGPAVAPPRAARGAYAHDLADVRGQHLARRALEIAAAGHHHLLMIGPPGGGKTMLARRLPGILPPLTEEEALEVTTVHSVAGVLQPDQGLLLDRPFRAPHHTVSDAGLVGGGFPPRPGELSLAHHGVLFLDEMPEFRRTTLETLRQPLEDGFLIVARARARATFPARPLLVAASNPCPCGYHGLPRCACPADRVKSYAARLSGPVADRLDLHVALPQVPIGQLGGSANGEPSAAVRARVVAARARQVDRARRGLVGATSNAALSPADVEAAATPDADGRRLLLAAVERQGLSARAYGKVLRVARTIADLEADDVVASHHVAEALELRRIDAR